MIGSFCRDEVLKDALKKSFSCEGAQNLKQKAWVNKDSDNHVCDGDNLLL